MSKWNSSDQQIEHLFIDALVENSLSFNIEANFVCIQFIINSCINSDLDFFKIYPHNENNFILSLLLLNSTGYLDSSIDKALSVLFQKDKTDIKKVLQHKNIKNQTVLELLIRQGRSDLALSLIENHQLDLTHPNHSSQYLVLSCRSLGTTKKPEKDYKLLSLFLDHILSNKIAISLEAFDII